MTREHAIQVVNVSKDFWLGFRRTSLIKGMVERAEKKAGKLQVIHALRNVNFSVKRGEAFGIIGPNASGKTTLLKLIAGILKATDGRIEINGDLIAFVELGLGFQDELTALENIYLYSAFLGMTGQETEGKLTQIIGFSELGDFLNMKLKYFSTGMRSRLAFSVIAQAQTDIMLLDEFMAVGDMHFQEKCFNALEEFRRQGKAVVIVSQSFNAMRRLCQRALLLDEGRQIALGDVDTVIRRYESLYDT